MEGMFYEMPKHGWTCFHCGETFTTPGGARQHFGADPCADPACLIKVGNERGLLGALRAMEAKYIKLLEQTCDENGAVAREFYSLGADHARAVLAAEQRGYDRGLADGQSHPLHVEQTVTDSCGLRAELSVARSVEGGGESRIDPGGGGVTQG